MTDDRFFYRHPRNYGRRAVFGLDEPAPSLRTVNRPMSANYPGHPEDANNPDSEYQRRLTPLTVQPDMKPLLDALPRLENNNLKVVSLFAGGGLLDLGMIHAGYEIIEAYEWNYAAATAYRLNIGDHLIGPRSRAENEKTAGNVACIDPYSISDCDGIIGGPPCQDFSIAGKNAGEAGDKGKLVWDYFEIIKAKQPKFFLFENVKNLAQKSHKHTLEALLEAFREIGYNVSWDMLLAWDYGVAQMRERVFIVGIRSDLGLTYEFPKSEYELTGYHPVLRDTIGDLPEPVGLDNAPTNHGPKDYWEPKADYTYDQANRVQSMDAPSNTIPAHHNSGQPIHPTQNPRRFSVREALRIQSVPDSYVFPEFYPLEAGKKPRKFALGSMYMIVGNGVPPRLAYHLGKALNEQLQGVHCK